MKKELINFLLCVTMFLFILGTLVLSVRICANDGAWIKREYEKLDLNEYTGMSTEDMCRAYMRMVDYMDGKVDSMELEVTVNGIKMQMFNEKEILHMQDVRRLYKAVETFMWICFSSAAFAAAAAVLIIKREAAEMLFTSYLTGLGGILCLVLALVIWGLLDFSGLWIKFHEIFLDLEGSTFDPMYSRMIRICPEELFSDIILRILRVGTAILSSVGVLLFILKKVSSKCHPLKEKAV